jgi:hypothetical protein
LTVISYYPVPHLILNETCPLWSIFLFRDKQLKQIWSMPSLTTYWLTSLKDGVYKMLIFFPEPSVMTLRHVHIASLAHRLPPDTLTITKSNQYTFIHTHHNR